jgi:hypothetical protein
MGKLTIAKPRETPSIGSQARQSESGTKTTKTLRQYNVSG